MESNEFESEDLANDVIEDVDADLDSDDELGDDSADDSFADETDDQIASDETDYTNTSGKPVLAMSTLPVTGEARVDDALARLNDLTNLPVHEHVEVFEDVQRRLHETLADLSGQ